MNYIRWIRSAIKEKLFRLQVTKKLSILYCVENQCLPSLFTRMPSNALRRIFNLPTCEYVTQLNQDIFALLINRFQVGFYIEIGANDGFILSNTVYLEKEFGWAGILIEPNPKYLKSLSAREKAIIVNKAVSSKIGKASFIDAGLYGGLESSLDSSHSNYTQKAALITVACSRLQDILDTAGAPDQIDFISVDVEGGEVTIVEQMVAGSRRFRCGCIEHNQRKNDHIYMIRLLTDHGYQVVWEGQTAQDLFFIDTSMLLRGD